MSAIEHLLLAAPAGLRALAKAGCVALALTLCAPAGAAVQLLLERDTDVSGQTDLFLISYADQASFLADTGLVQTALPQPIAPGFSAGGLAFIDTAAPPPPTGVPEPPAWSIVALGLALIRAAQGRRRSSLSAR